MREFSDKITLVRNLRGVYSLDVSVGCSSGMNYKPCGCYYDCYAAKQCRFHGFNFCKTVLRYFECEGHRREIVKTISRIKSDFIRIGTSGDPSENWGHTIDKLKSINGCNKEIVLVTKHWSNLSQAQLEYLGKINITINSSVSALDDKCVMLNAIEQYKKLKYYCKSFLRIVSAQFNINNDVGKRLNEVQNQLFNNDCIIDTILRVSKDNPLIKNHIIKTNTIKFLGYKCRISRLNENTYIGPCGGCKEKCGVAVEPEIITYPHKIGLVKQLQLGI